MQTLQHFQQRLISTQSRVLDHHGRRFISLTAKLDAMSPLKVLSRGYAMTQKCDGEVVRSVKQLAPGDVIKIVMSDGVADAIVDNIEENGL